MSRAPKAPERKNARPGTSKGSAPADRPAPTPAAARVLWMPLALTMGLALLAFLPRVQANASLSWSFRAAVAGLLVWQGVLLLRMRNAPAAPQLAVTLRANHYVQVVVQLALFAYWGWYWRPIYDQAGLIAAQLLFGYAFQMLLAWSRGEPYRLGFGPIPIIFSINIFLWFRDDWFYLQFLMVAVGLLGKDLLLWHREGRMRHIFNPSAFTLTLFSIALIATNATDLTRGSELASTLTLAPNFYTLMFLAGLVHMYLFSITLMSAVAAATIFGLSAWYAGLTGVPYFIDSEIPAAVFLGLHLLFTDPATSPRTALGKALFGVLYGLGVFASYEWLNALGAPTFYDKLLCVPLLNLIVPAIDRAVRSAPLRLPWQLHWSPMTANLAWMAVWIAFFGAMTAAGKTDGRHVGDSLPFWERACESGRRHACQTLIQIETSYCADNSGWACNELGRHYMEGTLVAPDREQALTLFARACEGRFQPGCLNLLAPDTPQTANPRALDLRLLLRERGLNLMEMAEPDLYARACEHGWAFACERRAGGLP
ncbi:MAG: hypothetical protein IT179_06670 [Acidobacteria bacterium]|nr:hypothetical protein [Acidobacteriota bacterium]